MFEREVIMTRDGYWLNYETMKWLTITEHETWIRDEANATKLGVPPGVFRRFKEYVPHDERERFLTWLLAVTPLLRIRGHLESITFEFSDPEVEAPLKGIAKWCGSCAGVFSALTIRNLATGGEHLVRWAEFDAKGAAEALRKDGATALGTMRAGHVMSKIGTARAEPATRQRRES